MELARSLAVAAVIASGVFPAAAAAQTACPTTTPQVPRFAPPARWVPERAATAVDERYFWYGTADLWTRLPIDGRLGRRDKIFWWHPGYNGAVEPVPAIAISIARFGSAVVREAAGRPTNAFFDNTWSMLTVIDFPEEGCWRVTAAYAGHELTFVARVDRNEPPGSSR